MDRCQLEAVAQVGALRDVRAFGSNWNRLRFKLVLHQSNCSAGRIPHFLLRGLVSTLGNLPPAALDHLRAHRGRMTDQEQSGISAQKQRIIACFWYRDEPTYLRFREIIDDH